MVSRIVGAPLAGLIVASLSTTPVLGLKAMGAILAIFCVSRIQSPTTLSESKKESHFSNFIEGIQYIGKNRVVLTHILLYLIPFFINNSYTGLLPYYATNVLRIDADLYGVMNAAPGIGSSIAIFALASSINLRRKTFFLILAGIIQGVSLVAFGLLPTYLLSLILITIIGGAGTIFGVLNNTLIQEMIPDQIRGRVMSLREVAFGLGPSFSLITGSIAGAVGVSLALGIAGGIPAVILLIVLFAVRRIRHLPSKTGAGT
jgi:Na+/melibiose symporter-like transporter